MGLSRSFLARPGFLILVTLRFQERRKQAERFQMIDADS